MAGIGIGNTDPKALLHVGNGLTDPTVAEADDTFLEADLEVAGDVTVVGDLTVEGSLNVNVDPSTIDHTLLQNVGTNTHAEIDTELNIFAAHIDSDGNPHEVTTEDIGAVPASSIVVYHDDGSVTQYDPAADTDQARGTALKTAVAAMVAGEMCVLGPGVFNIDAAATNVDMVAGTKLKGAGIGITIIQSAMTTGTLTGTFIKCYTDCICEDFTVQGTAVSGTQLPIGSTGTSNTGLIFRRIETINGADGLYFWGGGFNKSTSYDCRFTANYDSFVSLTSNAGEEHIFYNCYFEAIGPWPGSTIVNNCVNKAGLCNFHQCHFKSVGDGDSTQTLACWNFQNNAISNFYDCVFDVSAPTGTIFDLQRATGGTGGFFVSGGYSSLAVSPFPTTNDLAATTYANRDAKTIQWTVFVPTGTVTQGEGKLYFHVSPQFNLLDINYAHAMVITPGTTNDTTIQITRLRGGAPVDVLSTPLTIASGATTGTGTINTSNDDLATDDILRVDVDTISDTPPKGLIVTLEAK